MEAKERKTLSGLRYLSFVLDEEEYCIDITKIKEIMGMIEITKIPKTPDFIKGVINLRGQIIPIIDLRLKFELPEIQYTDRTCIIVVELYYENELTLMGLVVDKIREVINIQDERITKIPYINLKVNSDYINGMAEINDRIIVILDITKVLTEEDFVLIKEIDEGSKKKEKKKVKV